MEDLAEQKAADISARIVQLETMSGENLKDEMGALKASLMENPSACLLLKDSDIGILVASLRKITGIALASASKPKAKKEPKAQTKFTQAELLEALNSDEF